MSNVFRFTEFTYSQVPDFFVDEMLPKLTRFVTVKLYLLVLRHAQRFSKTTVKINTSEVLLALGITIHSLTAARAELRSHNLVRSVEVNNQGLWAYTLLNPHTGNPLPDPRATVDFDTLSEGQVKAYFLDHLKEYNAAEIGDGLRANCPFHHSTKTRDRSLTISIIDHGLWHCFKCDKSGKLVDFEIAMAAKDRELLTRKEAHHRVRVRVAKLGDLEAVEDNEPIPTY